MRQLLGETHARVTAVLDQMRDLRADQLRNKDEIDRELRAIKHDMRNSEQVIHARLELADRRSGEIERRIGQVEIGIAQMTELRASVKELADGFDKLKEPLEDLINLRNRLMWGGATIVAIVTLLWIFVAPVYKQLIAIWLPAPPPPP